MTRPFKPLFRHALVRVAMVLAVFFALPLAPRADDWSEVAYISSTMGVKDARLCAGEGSRGALGCPSYAPSLTTTGDVFLTGGLTTNNISLTTVSTTWGYLGSGASYLPNLRSNSISTTNISATTINGVPVSSLGGSSTIISGTTTMVSGWPDALQCVDGSGNKKTFMLEWGPNTSKYFYIALQQPNETLGFRFVFNSDGSFSNAENAASTYNCNNKSISQLYADGQAFNFIGNSGAGGGALGDRLTSGTLAVTANSTGYVSLSTASSTWGYLGNAASYLPRLNTAAISATNISTTVIQISNTTLACSSGNAGTLRFNAPSTTLELCTGSGWQAMGVGVPAGSISAFASTTCPTGWSEYTPARGRFLRGIDNGAGNDPDGTRAPGATQADLIGPHNHSLDQSSYNGSGNYTAVGLNGPQYVNNASTKLTGTGIGTETRPKNVAVIYCQFNGTSNGWNNPLSGGSTVAGGSTGQIQYNTGGSFDANAGLTWTNASQLLTATNISTTALTMTGAISGTSGYFSGNIGIGTQTPTAKLEVSGTVSATILKLADSPPDPCTSAAFGSIKVVNGKAYLCRQ